MGWVYSIATKSDDGKRKLIQIANKNTAIKRAGEIATNLARGEIDTAFMPRSDLSDLRLFRIASRR
jgi:hypothetical protein